MTFGTDIFHPLLVPLTTYTFTTGSSDTDTVSATDEERLPPGGFSLRHGFPHWFGRAKRSATNSATSSRTVSGSTSTDDTGVVPGGPRVISGSSHQVSDVSATPVVARARMCPAPSGKIYSHGGVDVPVLDLLNYIRSTFDEEGVLDSIPLEAAGNPGAWHAWRSHRRSTRASDYDNTEGGQTDTWSLQSRSLKGTAQSRSPGEWNWTGVWEKRVQNGIQNSYMESVLFGNPPRNANDLVRSVLPGTSLRI